VVLRFSKLGGRRFVEASGSSQVDDWLDLGIQGFVEALGGSQCHISLNWEVANTVSG